MVGSVCLVIPIVKNKKEFLQYSFSTSFYLSKYLVQYSDFFAILSFIVLVVYWFIFLIFRALPRVD